MRLHVHPWFMVAGWLAVVGPLAAQTRHPSPGVQIGYSRADLGGGAGAQTGRRDGTLAGVFVRERLSRVLSLQPELLFARKGGRFTVGADTTGDGVPDITGVADLELAYIEAPVLLRLSLPRHRGGISPVVFGGVAPAFRIGCAVGATTSTAGITLPDCQSNNVFGLRGVDLGLVVGGGMQIQYARSVVSIDARLTSGIRGIGHDRNSVKNRALGILFGVTL
jgi:Outer membrane protein beta-barrel domain